MEPKWPWAAPACDLQARSPSLIEQALDAFLPDGWTLVIQGLSVIVPKLDGSRAQWIVVLEGDADRETFVKRWASGDKHVRAVIQSTGVSTEEEDLDDSEELEGKDRPRSDRSSEDEKEEGNEDAKGEGERDEDEEGEEGEEEDDNAEDEGDSDDLEGNDDDEGGDGGEGAMSKSASDRAGSSERTPTKEGRTGDGGKSIHEKGAESEVDSPVKIIVQGRGKGLLTKPQTKLFKCTAKLQTRRGLVLRTIALTVAAHTLPRATSTIAST